MKESVTLRGDNIFVTSSKAPEERVMYQREIHHFVNENPNSTGVTLQHTHRCLKALSLPVQAKEESGKEKLNK